MTQYNDTGGVSAQIKYLQQQINDLRTQPRLISSSIDRGGTQSADYDGTSIGAPGTKGWIFGVDETTGVGYIHINGRSANSVNSSFKNKIINSNFRINQRAYVSAASLASGIYGFDRWKATTASTTLTYTSAPQGQPITINSTGSIAQTIEQTDIESGTYVLSWQGTATGRVYNVGDTPPAYAASPVIVTMNGNADVVVEFTASGASKTLSKIQFESGISVTVYDTPSINDELSRCRRYYWRITQQASSHRFSFGVQISTALWNSDVIRHPVPMRVAPTYQASNNTMTLSDGSTTTTSFNISTAVSILAAVSGKESSVLTITSGVTMTGGWRPSYLECNTATTDRWIGFNAEF